MYKTFYAVGLLSHCRVAADLQLTFKDGYLTQKRSGTYTWLPTHSQTHTGKQTNNECVHAGIVPTTI